MQNNTYLGQLEPRLLRKIANNCPFVWLALAQTNHHNFNVLSDYNRVGDRIAQIFYDFFKSNHPGHDKYALAVLTMLAFSNAPIYLLPSISIDGKGFIFDNIKT